MSKKIDIKRTLGKQPPPLSIEDVEAMTRLIHKKNEDAIPSGTIVSPKVNALKPTPTQGSTVVKPVNYEKNTVTIEEKRIEPHTVIPLSEKGKRGRKPKSIMETERLLRVSVDLPESLFIQLKIAVIQQQTDMKTYIRQLVAKDILG
jgi:hypothetical protein